MQKYKLEFIVFIGGAVVMILELTGSRVLAPYLGTSIFVWTSLIGIILGSLSLGYYLGGKLSDKKTSYEIFSLILLSSGILIAFSALSKTLVLDLIQNSTKDIRIASVIGAITLFAPASIFLGMISPYAVKLKMTTLEKSGSTVGNLYALSTIGSIAGTFLAGFVLVAYFGHSKLLIILSIVMILISLLANFKKFTALKIILLILSIVYLNFTANAQAKKLANGIIDIDTLYSRVLIFEDYDTYSGKPIKRLVTDSNSSSAMFLNSDELVYPYTKFYRLADHFVPEIKNALIIGGGAYSYPKDFLKNFPEANLDVVEIDAMLTELAKKHFNLEENARLNIYHEDGRTFLNNNETKYDVIFGDAFKSFYSIPHQLTTIEATQKIYDSLNDDGAFLVNIISSIEGETSKFLQAEYKTFKEIFPQIYIFPVQNPGQPDIIQNILVVALKSEIKPSFSSTNKELNQYLKHLYDQEIKSDLPVLTDEYAPVDQYIMEFLKVLKI